MVYYRIAIHGSQSTAWRWKSPPLTSLHPVLGLLKLYRCLPKEQIRVFVTTSPHLMDVMLSRANNGLFSTAITADQLWESRCMSWIEIRRLEVELGSIGDHDQPYTWNMPLCDSYLLVWAKLLSRRERGEIEP